MSYVVEHRYVAADLPVYVRREGDLATVHVSASGTMAVRYPGKFRTGAIATYTHRLKIDDAAETHGGWVTQHRTITLPVQIRTPDGLVFTSDHVTLNDLNHFRDLRGTSQGTWTYVVHGQSQSIVVEDGESIVTAGEGRVVITQDEIVPSKSAPPLVDAMLGPGAPRRYEFDLYRVGTFLATISGAGGLSGVLGGATLRLLDPDGVRVATGHDGRLTYQVSLVTLDKSRDAQGHVRPWALEVAGTQGLDHFGNLWASVIGTSRIQTQVLKSRIDKILGVDGNKVSIYGDMEPVKELLRARLEFLDATTAGTFDILTLLDSRLKKEPQDENVSVLELKDHVPYTIAHHSRNVGEFHVSLYDLRITSIGIDIGASVHLHPPVPALKIDLAVQGEAVVKFGGFPIATIAPSGHRIALAAGIRLRPDGTFGPATWIQNHPLDLDVSWEAAVAAGLPTLGIGTWTLLTLTEFLEDWINGTIVPGFDKFLAETFVQAPHILAILHGDHLTYRSLRLDGDEIVFEYLAPLEPEPKPSPNYLGVIGRSAIQIGPQAWQIMPPSLGDTWSAPNLNAKIDHIVMVMMENRSFDHVLGYRAQTTQGHGSDGLTTDLIQFLGTKNFPVRKLKDSAIEPNALGLKTKFPIQVGHKLPDMTQQLGEIISDEAGRSYLSPNGFVENFRSRAGSGPILPTDVLGYYDGQDLPFAAFLADHYATCERFFASHPGPTLPNRMLWLTGDVQYDRTGEAILNNNDGENFRLSRAMNIFDLLTRKGISWRVYESFPSITMLRMFARYATDDTHIVDISKLPQDIAAGDLPAVTVIEPAMHHFPNNDDHPIADMYRGQIFLRDLYRMLRMSRDAWARTLLIITYDEHGGFYDHVIPPIAEVRSRPIETTIGLDHVGHTTAPTLVTRYGARVPTFLVSPWVPPAKGPDIVLDHCSLLKTILVRFCGQSRPFISDRVNASRSLDTYLSESSPRLNVPEPPVLGSLPLRPLRGRHASIDTDPVTRKRMDNGDVDFHAFGGMVARLLGR